jgi:hypothetical protein
MTIQIASRFFDCEKPAGLSLYPDPLPTGSALSIGCQHLAEGYYFVTLRNVNGRCLHQEWIWIDDTAAVIEMVPVRMAPGQYLLALENQKNAEVHAAGITVI